MTGLFASGQQLVQAHDDAMQPNYIELKKVDGDPYTNVRIHVHIQYTMFVSKIMISK